MYHSLALGYLNNVKQVSDPRNRPQPAAVLYKIDRVTTNHGLDDVQEISRKSFNAVKGP